MLAAAALQANDSHSRRPQRRRYGEEELGQWDYRGELGQSRRIVGRFFSRDYRFFELKTPIFPLPYVGGVRTKFSAATTAVAYIDSPKTRSGWLVPGQVGSEQSSSSVHRISSGDEVR